jgi:hypothetical protein
MVGSWLQETGKTSQRGFIALGVQYTTRERAGLIMIGGLSIKNYEKPRTEEETGVACIYRRAGLNGEALKEILSYRLYSVISWEASPCNVPNTPSTLLFFQL